METADRNIGNIENIDILNNTENEISFEAALARLEQIVRALESGEISLDRSITLYEEGVRLVGICSSTLSNAERRIKILVDSGEGLHEEDFVKKPQVSEPRG